MRSNQRDEVGVEIGHKEVGVDGVWVEVDDAEGMNVVDEGIAEVLTDVVLVVENGIAVAARVAIVVGAETEKEMTDVIAVMVHFQNIKKCAPCSTLVFIA